MDGDEGKEFERIEVRFIGSTDYSTPEKIKEINNTFYHILQSAEIGMDMKVGTEEEILEQKEVYNNYVNREINENSKKLSSKEKDFLIEIFNLKNEIELEKKFQLIKNEIQGKIDGKNKNMTIGGR